MALTPDAVVDIVRTAAVQYRFELSRHAREQMNKRNVSTEDVRHVLSSADIAAPGKTSTKWEIAGVDLDGEPLTVVVAIVDPGVLIVTAF